METWEAAFKELQARFVQEAAGRLERMQDRIDVLMVQPGERTALNELMRGFDAFAGSGGTYGFPGATRLALEGERACAALLRQNAGPTPPQLDRWRTLVEAIAATLSATAEPPQAPSRAGVPAAEPVEVLVVDGDPEVGRTLERLVEPEGMSVRGAATLAEATPGLERRLPEGLITEVALPDGSGYDLVRRVRALPGGDAPAVLIVSTQAGFVDKVEAIHCGADGYFEKPVDWDALARALQRLLEKSRVAPARVLFVEDDPHQAAFVSAVLGSAGYEVRVCDDPKRFEADLISFAPDLLILDLVLPWVTGYDLARYVRQDERHAALPILFLTTEGQLEARLRSARLGGDQHLLKPLAPSLLLATVAARVENARFVRSLLDRDGLTRLLTHTAFLERARALVARQQRSPERAAVWVMIDVDLFKSINDRFGHPVGDRVLSTLSALLRRRLRQSDTLGRYGGDEFAVLLEDLREDEAARLLSRLLEEFAGAELRGPDGSAFRAGFSAGVARLLPGMDLAAWHQAADGALYAAKTAGRSRVVAAGKGSAEDGPTA